MEERIDILLLQMQFQIIYSLLIMNNSAKFDIVNEISNVYKKEQLTMMKTYSRITDTLVSSKFLEKYFRSDCIDLAVLNSYLDMNLPYDLFKKYNTAIILGTRNGNINAKIQFALSIKNGASPILFRMTTSNLLSSLLSIFLDTNGYSTTIFCEVDEMDLLINLALIYLQYNNNDIVITGHFSHVEIDDTINCYLFILSKAKIFADAKICDLTAKKVKLHIENKMHFYEKENNQ